MIESLIMATNEERNHPKQEQRPTPVPQPITLSDRLKQSGVLGVLSGGPADLSTNPDHMEDFGK